METDKSELLPCSYCSGWMGNMLYIWEDIWVSTCFRLCSSLLFLPSFFHHYLPSSSPVPPPRMALTTAWTPLGCIRRSDSSWPHQRLSQAGADPRAALLLEPPELPPAPDWKNGQCTQGKALQWALQTLKLGNLNGNQNSPIILVHVKWKTFFLLFDKQTHGLTRITPETMSLPQQLKLYHGACDKI